MFFPATKIVLLDLIARPSAHVPSLGADPRGELFMSRSLLALMLLGLVGVAQGCRICDSPYDYSGPVMPCGESCGAGCGHSGHGHGGYVDSGYSGGHGGCSTCGTGGGHASQYTQEAQEYEGGTVIQGQPTPAPTPAPPMVPPQTRRPSAKPMTKATYDEPAPMTRSPYPAARNAKRSSGPIFW